MKLVQTYVLLLCCATLGCQQQKKTQPPDNGLVKVVHPDELALNTIELTDQQIARLGVKVAEAKLTKVQARRMFGGEVVIPPGQTIIVSAPIPGTVGVPKGTSLPAPGTRLSAKQPVLSFTPLLTPERDVLAPAERVRVAQTRADLATLQLDARRTIETAKVQVEIAQIAYDRAAELLKNKAGSQRSVDETKAQLKLARELLETAETRAKFLQDITLDEESGKLAVRTIEAPVAGVLQGLDVAPGETVVTGKVLFRIIKLERLWVRVPVYVGYLRDIDTSQPASVAEFGQSPNASVMSCPLASAPPSADPLASTVDVFYELNNAEHQLYPGQKLSVTVPIDEKQERLVIPWTAVLYDIHGGAWVYEQTSASVFTRRRVEVAYADGDSAVLERGLTTSAKVVTDGAAELFGTEFGVGH